MTKRPAKTTTPAKPKPTAAETYDALRNDIARLLDALELELEKIDELVRADPRKRCCAIELRKVRSDLVDLVAFTSGMERERVEGFLCDAERLMRACSI